jgi:capsular exopolysaccharide synthesis family protein
MTLVDYIDALRRNWIVILVLTLLGGIAAFAYAHTLAPQYRSVASVIIIPERGDNTSELVQGSSYVQNIVQSYAVLAAAPVVLKPVVDELGLDITPSQLANQVSVNTPLNTVVIDLAVTGEDREQAQQIANAIVASLKVQVAKLSPQGADGRPAVRMATIAPARLPLSSIAPNTRLYAAGGALAGLALGIVYALARRLLNNRIRTASDVTSITGVPVIGEIPLARRDMTVTSTVMRRPNSHLAEALRTLTANLLFVSVDNPLRVVLVTSSTAGEGKTSTALGLAITLAESGKRILVIDADLRRPAIGNATQLDDSIGLTDVLVGERTLAAAVQTWGHENVEILAGGTTAPNPGQLMASHRLREVIEEARDGYDVVLIDSAPLLTVSDGLWLSNTADGIVVVARSGRTKRRQLLATL